MSMGACKRAQNPAADLDVVVAWRIERLRHARYSAPLADKLARDTGYDVHALLELADRGCPVELAVRILAPIDRERGPC
jgi:hypothetical protein